MGEDRYRHGAARAARFIWAMKLARAALAASRTRPN